MERNCSNLKNSIIRGIHQGLSIPFIMNLKLGHDTARILVEKRPSDVEKLVRPVIKNLSKDDLEIAASEYRGIVPLSRETRTKINRLTISEYNDTRRKGLIPGAERGYPLFRDSEIAFFLSYIARIQFSEKEGPSRLHHFSPLNESHFGLPIGAAIYLSLSQEEGKEEFFNNLPPIIRAFAMDYIKIYEQSQRDSE